MTVQHQMNFDTGRAEVFAGRVAEMLDAGAAAAMMSLGHRLGLFETLASRMSVFTNKPSRLSRAVQ